MQIFLFLVTSAVLSNSIEELNSIERNLENNYIMYECLMEGGVG